MRLLSLLLGLSALAAPPAAREIRVPVTLEGEGKLTQQDLKASVASAGQARVLRLRGPQDDLLVLLVMDVAGDLNLVDLAKEALTARINTLGPKTHVAVLRAQDDLRVLLDPTADRARAASIVSAVPATGKSELLNTLETSLKLAEAISAKSSVRLAVFYVTDSSVQNYREDFTNPVINSSDSRDLSRRFPEGLIRERLSKLEESVAKYQTPVSIVHLDYRSDRLNETYQTGLTALASSTGGEAFICRSQNEIADAVNRALDGIETQYSVALQLPAKAPRIVSLELQAGEQKLRYRDRFVVQ